MKKYVNVIKKHITWNAWIVIFLGFLVLILLIKFGSKSSDGLLAASLINSSVFILAFSAILFSFFGYLAIAIKDCFFRSSQMKKLAKKYNLNYTKPKEPFTMTPKTIYQKNILDGKINGKNVLIYDFVRWYWFIRHNYITRSATIISIDRRKKEYRGFFTGLCPIKKINSSLVGLSKEKL
ncbi:hypothetical protein KAI52_03210 [Candidatus Parcubacteria bacterium]|nr:hypothetical protein [Candidatus Parcubacteria bacterium]